MLPPEYRAGGFLLSKIRGVDLRRKIKEYIFITIGMLMVSIGLYFFFMPQKLAIGGANGLAIVVNHWIPFLSIGNLMIIINIVLFIVTFIFIDTGFGIKTIYTSLGTSVIVSLFEKIIPTNILTLIISLLILLGTFFTSNTSPNKLLLLSALTMIEINMQIIIKKDIFLAIQSPP